jgi:glutamate-1-semialdehyde 2,1-aminomutase/spore coat polysaccharide biosynthesis protein SpsF
MKNNKPNIVRSNEIYERAKIVTPSGTQTFSKGVTQFVNGFAPKYISSAKGAHTWDVDGNKYLDYIMGCHPVILGHADPDINSAVIKQLEKGSTYSLMSELEVTVSEQLVEIIPCAEMVRFGKNGADATTAGVRVARAVTGRDHVAYCGYHGWHDWYIANTDLNSGIPDFNKELAHSFVYNDLDSLEKIFLNYPDKIAIVIMEPLSVLAPKCMCGKNCSNTEHNITCKNHFLHEVKKMAKHYGAVLMFDEIITGFRFSIGGAQEMLGVIPDLASFAKGISNGIPLSAIVGKKEYMKVLDETFFSFTYGGECIGLSAAEVCIPKLKREKVPDHLWNIGKTLKDGFNILAKQHNLEDFIQCIGYPCRTIVSFNGQGIYDQLEMKSIFQQELIRRGILWAAYHALSWSHNDKNIEATLNAFDSAMLVFKNIKNTNKPLLNFIEGTPVKPVFRKVSDFNSYTIKK